MRLTIILTSLALALGISCTAFSQEDMRAVPQTPFAKPRMSASAFNHDQHNEKAKIEDCGACHHGEEQGKKSQKVTSEGQSCSQCHPVVAKAGKTPLERAYHRQCQGCHETKVAGPLTCGQCHRR